MITKHESRWWNIWLFLSLNIIDKYKDDLWLTFIDLESVRKTIREELLFYSNKCTYDLETIIHHVNQNIKSKLCSICRSMNLLENWGENIYIDTASDRFVEYEWSNIAIIASNKQNVSNILKKLSQLGKEYLKGSKNVKNMELSTIEKRILALTFDTTPSDIYTTIELIVNSNLFCELWDRIIGDISDIDYHIIYEYGKIYNNNICLPELNKKKKDYFAME